MMTQSSTPDKQFTKADVMATLADYTAWLLTDQKVTRFTKRDKPKRAAFIVDKIQSYFKELNAPKT